VPDSDPDLREISRRPSPLQRVSNVWAYRELLGNLIRKDLKVRYKDSALGFAWTLLNPLLYLVIFTAVFREILRVDIPLFGIFLLSGLLAWNLFSNGLNGGAASIVGNAALVQKVWFPREILPIAAIGGALVHFVLQFLVLAAALVVFTHAPDWGSLVLLPVAIVVLLILTTALGIAVAAINVYLRDTQHLLELVLLAWFWMSAIVYNVELVRDRLGEQAWIVLLNPIIPIVTAFQRVIYNPPDCPLDAAPDECNQILPAGVDLAWYLRNLGFVAVGAVMLLFAALWTFGRLEDDFAEEI
jgi:ABC-2 type transport system permease protein